MISTKNLMIFVTLIAVAVMLTFLIAAPPDRAAAHSDFDTPALALIPSALEVVDIDATAPMLASASDSVSEMMETGDGENFDSRPNFYSIATKDARYGGLTTPLIARAANASALNI